MPKKEGIIPVISPIIEELLLASDEEFVIPGHQVATVRAENTCLHALMVLNSVGYSAIPVLDRDGRVAGQISSPMIFSGIKDELNYNWDQLSERRVSDVLSTDLGVIDQNFALEDVLHLLVNHSFICVVDEAGFFRGIVTRKQLLKRVNFLAHEYDNYIEDLEAMDLPAAMS